MARRALERDAFYDEPPDYPLPQPEEPAPPPAPQPQPDPGPAAPPPPPTPSPQPGPPPGVPQDWFDDFTRRNPGDAGRAASAYGSQRGPSSGGSGGGALPPVQAPAPNQNQASIDALTRMILDRFTGQQSQFAQQQSQYQQQQADYQRQVAEMMRQQQAREEADRVRRQQFEDQLRASLMDLIKRGQEPIPDVGQAPEAKAFARVQERALERNRAQQAEQRAAQGLGQNQFGEVSGALGSDIQRGQSELAEQIAAFESRLVAEQIQRRQAQLMQSLQLGAGMLSGEQQNAIRRELAQLDTALKQSLAQADLGLRSFLGGGELSLGLLGSLMGNEQFYDRLGADVGMNNEILRLRYLGL